MRKIIYWTAIVAFYVLIFITLIIAWTTPLHAQAANVCAEHDIIEYRLATQYGEYSHGMGIASNGTLIELFVNEETQSWTILVTDVTGMSCLTVAGEDWINVEPELLAPGIDG